MRAAVFSPVVVLLFAASVAPRVSAGGVDAQGAATPPPPLEGVRLNVPIPVVPDVEVFPGHVACSSASLSEVVVPIRNNHGDVVAVLDVDSAVNADFTSDDVKALEVLAGVISSHWNQWTWQP